MIDERKSDPEKHAHVRTNSKGTPRLGIRNPEMNVPVHATARHRAAQNGGTFASHAHMQRKSKALGKSLPGQNVGTITLKHAFLRAFCFVPRLALTPHQNERD